jgi:hypothetical protein
LGSLHSDLETGTFTFRAGLGGVSKSIKSSSGVEDSLSRGVGSWVAPSRFIFAEFVVSLVCEADLAREPPLADKDAALVVGPVVGGLTGNTNDASLNFGAHCSVKDLPEIEVSVWGPDCTPDWVDGAEDAVEGVDVDTFAWLAAKTFDCGIPADGTLAVSFARGIGRDGDTRALLDLRRLSLGGAANASEVIPVHADARKLFPGFGPAFSGSCARFGVLFFGET